MVVCSDCCWRYTLKKLFELKDVEYMDHVAFVKWQTVERLKTREDAEASWREAIADTVKFFLGLFSKLKCMILRILDFYQTFKPNE